MKYNTTYIQKSNLKETLINMETIKTLIKDHYNKKLKLISVTPPQHDIESSELIIQTNEQTRHISFDFGHEYRVGKLFLSHTN